MKTNISTNDAGSIFHKDQNGYYHNMIGPAVIWSSGEQWWIVRGNHFKNIEKHPFNIFRKDYNLSEDYEKWPLEMKILFKMIYG